MLVDRECRAFAVHTGKLLKLEKRGVNGALLVGFLHAGIQSQSPWRGIGNLQLDVYVRYLLPRQCHWFVGRDAALAELTRMFLELGLAMVVSTGLPGAGKSFLVIEWIYRQMLSGAYGVVAWLRAETLRDLQTDLVGLGKALRMPFGAAAGPSLEAQAAFVKKQLSHYAD